MAIRIRGGKLEWRFKISGHTYSHITDLGDTPRNRTKAQQMEAEARRLVSSGRESELRITPEPFSSAADAFCKWAEGEYADHPNSWKRLSGSMTGAKQFFGKRPLSSVTRGDLEDFKSWRRTVHKVREVTLRHDLHALSLLFQYGDKHNWCRGNLVRKVEIPSDAGSQRANVLSPNDEQRLFTAIEGLAVEKAHAAKRKGNDAKIVRALGDIRDLCILMLQQGCRPNELRALRQSDVDLERGVLAISQGKSAAARRTLPLTASSAAVLTTRLQTLGTWAFPSQKYPNRHIGQHQRLWAAIIKKAKLSCVMYDLRHTFATRAVECGVELPKLMAILGHANLRSIMRYVHMSQAHIDDGMRRMFDSLSTFCPPQTGKTDDSEGIRGKLLDNPTTNRIN